MKIEVGESLCYSYLRHVKGCWLVQTNWKASEHWSKRKTDAELEAMFQDMRRWSDLTGSVLKQTATVRQFMQQGEIDVMGVDQDGGVHAMDVAFHENGLNYGGGVANRVLKKLLRTQLLLSAYHPQETTFHIYFVSPKVHRAVQSALGTTFSALKERYPKTNWHLITNDDFHNQIVQRTLERTESVADTAELFVRAAKLLNLSAATPVEPDPKEYVQPSTEIPISGPLNGTTRFQDLVKGVIRTLLEECPDLLEESELQSMTDHRYCGRQLSLKISNHALLRERDLGREINGHSRYWKDLYAGRFYVCSQWWKDHHTHNANSLLMFLNSLSRTKPDHPNISKLEPHKASLRRFVAPRQVGDSNAESMGRGSATR